MEKKKPIANPLIADGPVAPGSTLYRLLELIAQGVAQRLQDQISDASDPGAEEYGQNQMEIRLLSKRDSH